ncbi:MAG: hypothetical protein U5J95_03595 [Balneolaceae bacterium]|nr:hypothetical protein [Balneolaceae bacterium]
MALFHSRNIEYQKEVWWQFTLLGDAPRYLRAHGRYSRFHHHIWTD